MTLEPGRFGSTRFMVGRRELGHLHGQTTLDHRWAKPGSGWVTVQLEPGPEGVERGITLLRERYEHALQRRVNA